MIIISNKPGQLGNLLFIYAGFLAWQLETGIRVLNPAFYLYKHYFKGTASKKHIQRVFYGLAFFSARVLHKLNIHTRLINVVALDNGEHILIDKDPAFQSLLCFAQGWLFRANDLVSKHRERIVSFFSPVAHYQKQLDDYFTSNFKTNDVIIAVHVRHGDYKTFQDGKYYYTLDQYASIIRQLNALFRDRDPKFMICSNVPIAFDKTLLDEITLINGPGHELLDMYAMSRCTFITGPPSTYTMWASFYGETPLYLIHEPDRPLSEKDFKAYRF